jgi:predicted site-specific integrase-resolvase
MTDKPVYVKTKHIADHVGVDIKTIHNWETQGEYPGIRTPGGHHRYLLSDINEFLVRRGWVPMEAPKRR